MLAFDILAAIDWGHVALIVVVVLLAALAKVLHGLGAAWKGRHDILALVADSLAESIVDHASGPAILADARAKVIEQSQPAAAQPAAAHLESVIAAAKA